MHESSSSAATPRPPRAPPAPPAPLARRLLTLWRRLAPLPGGRWLFTRLLGRMAPYSGSIKAAVTRLEPGDVEIVLRDRKAVRNHLRSVHAVALANLGELASGLALNLALPAGVRGIVTRLEVAYHKKARGTLTARSRCPAPPPDASGEHVVTAGIFDESGEEVATFTAHWLLGPDRRKGAR